ncbi:hypothetical protein ALC60_00676 [Trachymyrmex zeteki]|uniref:Uncharacterized protein n=1 Tax=Mycetomoellerius zeteki TaxID=64791 RepID=A0A151XJ10_9HYME|nr:hypothetical protein ALC60_00676 [Trachymyrmex zeteki]
MCASVVEYLRIGFFAFLSLQRERDTRSVFRDCSPLPYRTFRERLTASGKPTTTGGKSEKKRERERERGRVFERTSERVRDEVSGIGESRGGRGEDKDQRERREIGGEGGERERERKRDGRDPRTAVPLVYIYSKSAWTRLCSYVLLS